MGGNRAVPGHVEGVETEPIGDLRRDHVENAGCDDQFPGREQLPETRIRHLIFSSGPR
jgi:hypothetical protein